MKPAKWPREQALEEKLLVIQAETSIVSSKIWNLPDFLSAGDLMVVNDAATFPASLIARTESGEELEVRLLPRSPEQETWQAILFGKGDWRIRTEDRLPPPHLKINQILYFDDQLNARVVSSLGSNLGSNPGRILGGISPTSNKWVEISFNLDNGPLWRKIYQLGKPIQYSYLKERLDLWHVQTHYASKPWAAEMPSAGRPLNGKLLLELQKKGVKITSLTHATGISSTGDSQLDRLLPFPEFFSIPEETVEAIQRAHLNGNRVIAVGTSVVRAIEGQAINHSGTLLPGNGRTDLIIDAHFRPQWISGILTGIHEIGESHFKLLEAFSSQQTLQRAIKIAENNDYQVHEFGDSSLILKSRATLNPCGKACA